MRWKIGDFEFDEQTGHLRGTDAVRLQGNEFKILKFLIKRFGEDYENDEIIYKVWNTPDSVHKDVLYKAIQKLRNEFGGARDSYIASRPYKLVFEPVLVEDERIAPPQIITVRKPESVAYRTALGAPVTDTHPDIAEFLSETRYGISPIDEYLPIYPVYAGLTRDEIEYKYQGEYEPPEDFLKLMKRYPPEPPINQLYSFHGWEGEIPSEDELAGKEGKQLILNLQGGSWHHIHALNQIRKACNMTPPDQTCLEFRANHLKTLIPISSSTLYHNANAEVIVVTADDQIVIARRKGAIVFAGSWTASLEEQMLRRREKDGLSDGMDIFSCAERGARGELGITVISEHTRLLSVGVEFGNFTAAFLVLIRSAETFREIATKTWPNASECDEAVALDALPAQPTAIGEVLKADQYYPDLKTCIASPRWNSPGDPRTPGPWHPVARARLDAYLRHIASRPYSLVVRPIEILDDDVETAEIKVIKAVSVLDSARRGESSSGTGQKFTLIVDGMIVNSVAELIQNDPRTEPIRRICHASYERSLDDFAFALVYGSKLITSRDFRRSVTAPEQAGQELAARLGEVCEQVAYPPDIGGNRLLQDEATCEKIRADIEQFARCVANPGLIQFFRDYMVREASKHLGVDSSLFQEDLAPGKYIFDVKNPYYEHRSLQDALGEKVTDSLVRFLPSGPPHSEGRYAVNALREFATRNVLSLITITWESDVFAQRTQSWRLPHLLRSLVRQGSLDNRARTEQQKILRDMIVQHALGTAFRHMRKTRAESLVTILLNQRDDPPFKEIRQILEQEHLVFLAADPANEKRARKILRLINSSATSNYLDPDYLSLQQRSALRRLRTTLSKDYEFELYRVFPALRPPE